jgi:hypothetical protein
LLSSLVLFALFVLFVLFALFILPLSDGDSFKYSRRRPLL